MRNINMKGNPVTLVGEELKVGDMFPNFKAVDKNLQEFDFAKTEGVRVILAVPSIDTPICDLEVKRVAKEVADSNINLIAISMDLPFAQTRWCVDTENEHVQIVSDYKDREFGKVTGTLIQELALLARVSFVVGKDGKIEFAEYLDEVGSHPSYEKIMEVAKVLI